MTIDQTRQMELQRKQIDQLKARPVVSGGGGAVALAYTNNGSYTFADGADDVIDFANVQFDPASAITTGAAWKYTAPSDMGILLVTVFAEISGNLTAWAADGGMATELFKNGSQAHNIAFQSVGDGVATIYHDIFLFGSYPVSVSSGDYLQAKLNNYSGDTRVLILGAYILIERLT